MPQLRDTETGEIIERNAVDAAEILAQEDGRYELVEGEARPKKPAKKSGK